MGSWLLRAKIGQSFSWMCLNRYKLSKRDLKLLQKANFKLEIKISQIRDRNEHINKHNVQTTTIKIYPRNSDVTQELIEARLKRHKNIQILLMDELA